MGCGNSGLKQSQFRKSGRHDLPSGFDFGSEAADGVVERLCPSFPTGSLASEAFHDIPCRDDGSFQLWGLLAGLSHGRFGCPDGLAGSLVSQGCGVRIWSCAGDVGLYVSEPGPLRHSPGGGFLGIGPGDEAVPAPQITFDRHNPHAGHQLSHQLITVFSPHETGHGQAGRELRRGVDQ